MPDIRLLQPDVQTPPVAAGRGVALEVIRGQVCAVDVLAEEPIHFAIAFEIHLRAHVFFDDGLEVLGGGGLEAVGAHEVLHGGFETRVAVFRRPHHHADHVQDVSAFGIDDILINAPAGLGRTEANAHGHGTDIDGPEADIHFFA